MPKLCDHHRPISAGLLGADSLIVSVDRLPSVSFSMKLTVRCGRLSEKLSRLLPKRAYARITSLSDFRAAQCRFTQSAASACALGPHMESFPKSAPAQTGWRSRYPSARCHGESRAESHPRPQIDWFCSILISFRRCGRLWRTFVADSRSR